MLSTDMRDRVNAGVCIPGQEKTKIFAAMLGSARDDAVLWLAYVDKGIIVLLALLLTAVQQLFSGWRGMETERHTCF